MIEWGGRLGRHSHAVGLKPGFGWLVFGVARLSLPCVLVLGLWPCLADVFIIDLVVVLFLLVLLSCDLLIVLLVNSLASSCVSSLVA